MIAPEVIQQLECAREVIVKRGKFPPSLTGACVVSSAVAQGILEQHNIDSIIVNNSKHTFCLVNGTHVVDLTATQINKSDFSPVEFASLEEMRIRVKRNPKARTYYNTADEKFLIKGNLNEYLRVNESIEKDEQGLMRLLRTLLDTVPLQHPDFSKLRNADQITIEYVNSLAAKVRQALLLPLPSPIADLS